MLPAGIIEMGAMFSNPRSVSFGHDGQSVLVTDTYAVRQVCPTNPEVKPGTRSVTGKKAGL